MSTLLLMRHAKSSWKDASLADHDRPLNKRGQRDAPRMGTLLSDERLNPACIVSSSATRALSTAEIIARSTNCDRLDLDSALYHASVMTWLETLERLPSCSPVLCVGHNPGLEHLLEILAGEWHRMPTAAIAVIDVDGEEWSDFVERVRRDEMTSHAPPCLLRHIYRPKEL